MSAEQLELGEFLRDKGIAQVLDNNESYKDRFYRAAEKLLMANGRVMSTDVVSLIGMPSGSPNAVGASMRSFACKHGLSVARYLKSDRPTCHAAIVAVWEKTA